MKGYHLQLVIIDDPFPAPPVDRAALQQWFDDSNLKLQRTNQGFIVTKESMNREPYQSTMHPLIVAAQINYEAARLTALTRRDCDHSHVHTIDRRVENLVSKADDAVTTVRERDIFKNRVIELESELAEKYEQNDQLCDEACAAIEQIATCLLDSSKWQTGGIALQKAVEVIRTRQGVVEMPGSSPQRVRRLLDLLLQATEHVPDDLREAIDREFEPSSIDGVSGLE